VTVDGLLPDAYLHPDAHGLRVPTLRRLVAHGAVSDGALSVFPTVTYPSHTTMTTGVVPGKHGIVANRTFDPLDGDLEGWRWYAEDIQRDPIWRVTERAGYPTALVNWPVSVGARVTWLAPEYWRARDENDPKLLRALSTPGLLESVAREHPGFWSRYASPNAEDEALMDVATYLLREDRPVLLQLHLVEVDAAQHHDGVWSAAALAAIEGDDRQLGRLFDLLAETGLARDTDVIVASDHGFMNVGTSVRPGVVLREAGLVTVDGAGKTLDWKATVLTNGGQAYVYVKDPADMATRKAVQDLFAARLGQPGSGIGRAYSPDEIRAAGGDPAAALALEASPGFQLAPGYTGEYAAPSKYVATHGFDPNRPEMKASLLLLGPNVPHGTIRDAHLADIAPTIAAWLGLSMGAVDGAPLQVTPMP
jgi:predicted AlkP superfamily pyrophosphatase or phosphodiesterase